MALEQVHHPGHKVVKCNRCDTVVMQCRCTSKDKAVEWVRFCDACEGETTKEANKAFARAFIERIKVAPVSIPDMERELVLVTLAFFEGNRSKTACMLRMPYRTLTSRLAQYQAAGYKVTAPKRGRPW